MIHSSCCNGKFVRYVVLTLFGVLLGYTLGFLIEHLNILYFDTSGHAASAYFFGKYGFHSYVPEQFGGYIQNLLYPPLQDVLVHSMAWSSGVGYLKVFHRYMLALLLAYGYVRFRGTDSFTSYRIKALWLLVAIVFLRTDRQYIIMGGSLDDMIRIGLLPQILGCVFFLLLLYELLGKRRFRYVTGFLTVAVLSHLVMGLLSLGVVAAVRLIETIALRFDKTDTIPFVKASPGMLIKSLVLTVGFTAFFRFPFVLSLGSSAVGMIVQPIPYALFGVLLLGLPLGLRKATHRGMRALAAGVTMVARVAEIKPDRLPVFHYARLLGPAFMIASFAVLLHMDELAVAEKKKQMIVGIGAMIGLLGIFTVQFPLSFPRQRQQNPDFSMLKSAVIVNHAKNTEWFSGDVGAVPLNPIAERQRTDHGRSRILFGNTKISPLLSASQALGFDLHSVNGLYRESHYSNLQFVSLYATLFGNVGFILPQYQAFGFSCEEYERLWSAFVDLYAISTLVFPKTLIFDVGPPEMQACLREYVLEGGIQRTGFSAAGSISIASADYTVFVHSGIQLLEILSPQTQIMGVPSLDSAHRTILQIYYSRMKEIEPGSLLLLDEMSVPEVIITPSDSTRVSGDASFSRNENGEGMLVLPEGNDQRFRIKAHRFPGMTLLRETGEQTVMYPEAFGMIGKGSGTMKIVYKIPVVFRIGYSISILSCIGVLVWILRIRKRIRTGT